MGTEIVMSHWDAKRHACSCKRFARKNWQTLRAGISWYCTKYDTIVEQVGFNRYVIVRTPRQEP